MAPRFVKHRIKTVSSKSWRASTVGQRHLSGGNHPMASKATEALGEEHAQSRERLRFAPPLGALSRIPGAGSCNSLPRRRSDRVTRRWSAGFEEGKFCPGLGVRLPAGPGRACKARCFPSGGGNLKRRRRLWFGICSKALLSAAVLPLWTPSSLTINAQGRLPPHTANPSCLFTTKVYWAVARTCRLSGAGRAF